MTSSAYSLIMHVPAGGLLDDGNRQVISGGGRLIAILFPLKHCLIQISEIIENDLGILLSEPGTRNLKGSTPAGGRIIDNGLFGWRPGRTAF